MQNKLSDLNNHLFAEMERLTDEGMSQEQMKDELLRANGVSKIARCIIDTAKVRLDTIKHAEYADGSKANDLL